VRIVIGEDSVLLREGIARLLGEAGYEVVGQAGDAEDLLRKTRAHRPDVVIVDIRMPPGDGNEGLVAARQIREELPEVGVLVLSQYAEEHFAAQLLEYGSEGVGYLLKDRVGEVERFIEAVRSVARGGSVLDPQVVALMLGRARSSGPLDELTPREREVIVLMAEGATNHAIAERMVITERAVERHVTSIFQKLGLVVDQDGHRRVLAVLTYLRSSAS
jgi:DNA-binding NarL/FixJ family response regulator